jgi:hypothetical protein
MQYEYFIFENVSKSNQLTKVIPAQILKVPRHEYNFKFSAGDGGYSSIKKLQKQSSIFKRIARTNSKLASKVLEPKNIQLVKGCFIDDINSSYTEDYIGLYDHLSRGHIKNKDVQGVHIFDKSLMKIVKYGEMNTKTLVWQAQISKYDRPLDRWVTKKRMSNFFPIHCDKGCLFKQIEYAYDNKVKVMGSNSKYTSATKCGIPVVIIVDEKTGKTKTMYPLLD